MKKLVVTLVGAAPYSQSAPVQSKKNTGEANDAFEERTWREHMHVEDGEVYIPGTSIKNCLSECARFLGESVPGKGKSTYTKHFQAGIMVPSNVRLGIKAKDVPGERLFLNADGRRGGNTRVWKTYPRIDKWEGEAEVLLLDPILADKPEKVVEYMSHAGKFIGIGRFRPRNNGFYGRFTVKSWRVEDVI